MILQHTANLQASTSPAEEGEVLIFLPLQVWKLRHKVCLPSIYTAVNGKLRNSSDLMHRARISEEILQLPIIEFFHLLHLSLSLEYKAILPISCTTCLYSILKQQVLQSRFVKASNAEVAVKCGMGGAAPLLSSSCSTVAVLLGRRLLLGVFL